MLRILDDGGTLAGVAVRPPPFAMLLSELAEEPRPALADHLVAYAPQVRRFTGLPEQTRLLADAGRRRDRRARRRCWRRTACSRSCGCSAGRVTGHPREAAAADRDLLVDWSAAFQREALADHPQSEPGRADRRPARPGRAALGVGGRWRAGRHGRDDRAGGGRRTPRSGLHPAPAARERLRRRAWSPRSARRRSRRACARRCSPTWPTRPATRSTRRSGTGRCRTPRCGRSTRPTRGRDRLAVGDLGGAQPARAQRDDRDQARHQRERERQRGGVGDTAHQSRRGQAGAVGDRRHARDGVRGMVAGVPGGAERQRDHHGDSPARSARSRRTPTSGVQAVTTRIPPRMPTTPGDPHRADRSEAPDHRVADQPAAGHGEREGGCTPPRPGPRRRPGSGADRPRTSRRWRPRRRRRRSRPGR